VGVVDSFPTFIAPLLILAGLSIYFLSSPFMDFIPSLSSSANKKNLVSGVLSLLMWGFDVIATYKRIRFFPLGFTVLM